jgi:hypothetical protein
MTSVESHFSISKINKDKQDLAKVVNFTNFLSVEFGSIGVALIS